MSVHAVATVTAVNMNFGNGTYDITVQFSAAAEGTSNFNQFVVVRVPFVNDAKHADSFLRSSLAALALSNFGLTIDPDDIYFPI